MGSDTEPMLPDDFRAIREGVGFSQEGLADLWNMGKGGGRTVRRWETGETPIPGPVAFAITAMKNGYMPGKKRKGKANG